MIEHVFTLLLTMAAAYAGCGAIVALFFLARWIEAFDPSAKAGAWGFRTLIVPGVIALWPVVLQKVLAIHRGGSGAGEADRPVSAETLRRSHGIAFIVLALLGLLLFVVALGWRAPRLDDTPVVEASAKRLTR